MTADPIWVGGVYIEDDVGSDLHGDTFQITFNGGAPGTQLSRLIIDGDLNTPGFGLGDLFFDTLDSGYGALESVAECPAVANVLAVLVQAAIEPRIEQFDQVALAVIANRLPIAGGVS